MSELNEYIFMDDDHGVLTEMGLHDDDVADCYCIELSKRYNENVSCYRLVSFHDPTEKEEE
jgi:hypothetical protein